MDTCQCCGEYHEDLEPEDVEITGGALLGGARKRKPVGAALTGGRKRAGGCQDYYGSALVGGAKKGGCKTCGAALMGGRKKKPTGAALMGGRKRKPVGASLMGGNAAQKEFAEVNPWIQYIKALSEQSGLTYGEVLKQLNTFDYKADYADYKKDLFDHKVFPGVYAEKKKALREPRAPRQKAPVQRTVAPARRRLM